MQSAINKAFEFPERGSQRLIENTPFEVETLSVFPIGLAVDTIYTVFNTQLTIIQFVSSCHWCSANLIDWSP